MGFVEFLKDFFKHSKRDKHMLYLTISVWVMFAAATTLIVSAILMETQSVVGAVLFFTEWLLTIMLRPLILLIAMFAWGAILWILDVYFVKAESRSEIGQKGKFFLLSTFVISGIMAYLLAVNLPNDYVLLYMIGVISMIGAITFFQWVMNRDP